MARQFELILRPGQDALADRHPKVWAAYEHLGEAVAEGGPLDAKTRRLVKLALAIGYAGGKHG